MHFERALLQEVETKPSDPPKTSKPITVQINPATLRIQTTASVDAGKDTGRQRTQYQGTTSTLSFDLVFDTSDEGTTDEPLDVRKRTAEIERFVWPAKKKAAPPRVQFKYGTLTVTGVMTSVNIDLDLFSANGVPLRAKCAVQIKEQKTEFDLAQDGAGANNALGATPPLQPGTAGQPSSGAANPGPTPTDRTGTANAGESAPSFATRMGLDPKAWKGLQGISDPMSLQAGQQIDFSSALSLEAGLGAQAGPVAGLLGPAGGGATDPASPVPPSPLPAAVGLTGHDLTSAGGLTSVLNQLAAGAAGTAATAAASSFGSTTQTAGSRSPGAAGAVAAPSTQPGAAGTPATGRSGSASGQPGQPGQPDPRAITYGYGVPLRPRRAIVGPTTLGLVHERHRAVMAGGELPPESRDVTVPGWQALAVDPAAASSRAGSCGCGCAGSRRDALCGGCP